MVINWYGEGCFKIQTGGLVLLTDPFESSTGLTPPRFKADIILKTIASLPLPYETTTEEQTVMGPGDYEIKGIDVRGMALKGESDAMHTAYLAVAEDMRLAFLGHLSTTPDLSLAESMGEIDILFMPFGGKPFIDEESAVKLVKQLNPKMVVASFFKIPGLKRSAGDVKDFLKEFGQEVAPVEKLTIKKKELPTKMQIVVLSI